MADIITRKVVFDYFRPTVTRVNKEGTERTFVKYFDVLDWLDKLKRDEKTRTSLELGEYSVYLDEIYHYTQNNNYHAFNIFKLRDTHLPSLIKEGDSAKPIPLRDDENVGEEMNVFYDQCHSILMVQRNRMSVGIIRLAEWMTKCLEDKHCRVELRPLYNNVTGNFFGTKRIKKLSFTVESLGTEQYKGKALGTIINGMKCFGQRKATITLSVGRERSRFLDHCAAVDAIDEILDEGGRWFSSAFADVCDMNEEKGNIEKVDLFENLLHDTITFNIRKKKPLDFKQARIEMYKAYVKRIEEIHTLLQ